jgi:glutamine cyclotransferase
MFFELFFSVVLYVNPPISDGSPKLSLANNSHPNSSQSEAQSVIKKKTKHSAHQVPTKLSLLTTTDRILLKTTDITTPLAIGAVLFLKSQLALSTSQNFPPPLQDIESPLFTAALQPQVLAIEAYNQEWFTQGLYKDREGFYISSGLYNKSILIYQSPSQTLRYLLPPNFFAEGLTVIDDKLFLLTWREKTLLIFDKKTLTLIDTIAYKGEGWGLTHNKESFIMSDGSNVLKFRDKNSFEIQYTLTIKDLNYINELEYVDGVIWANRWYDEKIYALDSHSGCILASINLEDLRLASITHNQKNVSNGIAYDREKNALWVTGKYWNQRFLIALPTLDHTHCDNSLL